MAQRGENLASNLRQIVKTNAEMVATTNYTFERKLNEEKVEVELEHQQESRNEGSKLNQNASPPTSADSGRWWRRTRIHVAILGLTIAAVNCYAQATFCIAIVEMVLPADYVIKGEGGESIVKVTTRPISGPTSNLEATADQSCPVEYKYRDYYDDWRFPPELDAHTPMKTANFTAATSGTNNRQDPHTISGLLQPLAQARQPVLPTSQTIDVSNRFDWGASSQGILLGAFAFGTAPLQVLGGRLAEIYGAKWVLLAGCIGTALTNLTIPLLARLSFPLLVANRILMGVAQAGMEPGLMCLLAEWLTPKETGFFISMLLFAMCIGTFFGSLCSSFLLAIGYHWQLTYYVCGGINLFVGLIWFLYADSSPRSSKYISRGELAFIECEQQHHLARSSQVNTCNKSLPLSTNNDKEINCKQPFNIENGKINIDTKTNLELNISTPLAVIQAAGNHEPDFNTNIALTEMNSTPGLDKQQVASLNQQIDNNSELRPRRPNLTSQTHAPWMNILKTPSVWAFIICKISIRWCADVLAYELPTYLANVLHLSIKINGILNSVSSALFAIFSFVTGWLVNELVSNDSTNRSINKTTLRKLMQSTASFGSALLVFLMTRYDCNILFSMSMLLLLSCCLVMGTGGELQIPYDMTSRYPGTLHGMACTLCVSGWLAPPLIGAILADEPSSREKWNIVWYTTATINVIGGLVFVLFADASPRNFDSKLKVCRPISSCNEQNLDSIDREGGGRRGEETNHSQKSDTIWFHNTAPGVI